MPELLIALNPAQDSKLGYLLRIPQPGGDLVFRTSDTWPRVKALYCHPVSLTEWPDDADIVERLPLRSCQRRGGAIDVILDRARENRSQLVFTTARGRDVVFWQSPRTRKPWFMCTCGSTRHRSPSYCGIESDQKPRISASRQTD